MAKNRKLRNWRTRAPHPWSARALSLSLFAFCVFPASAQTGQHELLQMSLEELLELKISTVSRREQSLPDAPAAIYVITRKDIVSSGATTLPQVLRLAPNLQVAQISNGHYAISARGFNASVANKLLVLLDGRTLYTPLFSGVFWDQQDYLLADIERIEVVSGPGATMWGSNAVNGVINIVTRTAADTRGLRLSAHNGSHERGAEMHYSGGAGELGHYRVYAKTAHFDHNVREDGTSLLDETERHQAGFRFDWQDVEEVNQLTVQGDAYEGRTQNRGVLADFDFRAVEWAGANILARWSRRMNGGSRIRLQGYLDHTERNDQFLFQPRADIVDIDFQHSIPFRRHHLIWGVGHRQAKDQVDPGFVSNFVPDRRVLNWTNIFVQDHIKLNPSLEATLGLRAERNSYTGSEYLPNVRLAWKVSEDQLVWTSLSRAVRAPSRLDRDVYFPAPPNAVVVGGPNFESEVARVVEAGYRAQHSERLMYSVTAFYHDWRKLRSGTSAPVEIENKIEGGTYGVEMWGNFQATPTWKLSAGAFLLEKDLRLRPDSTDPVGVDNATLANDPDAHYSLRSSSRIGNHLLLDLQVRRVGRLRTFDVPGYTALDAHLRWKISDRFSLYLTGRNLNGGQREFEYVANGPQLQREALLGVTWTP